MRSYFLFLVDRRTAGGPSEASKFFEVLRFDLDADAVFALLLLCFASGCPSETEALRLRPLAGDAAAVPLAFVRRLEGDTSEECSKAPIGSSYVS